MYLVKLNATTSTNTYLRQLSKNIDTPNWTVVTAEFQSLGRGLTQTKWVSDKGKNLLCSILIKFDNLKVINNFHLSCAISIGVYNGLIKSKLSKLYIKWPNDIMSGSFKMGGILIENIIKNDQINQSIVGLGLNINQEFFPSELPHARSMKQIKNIEFNRDEILMDIVESIKEMVKLLKDKKFDILHSRYENILYAKGKVQMFEDNKQQKFMGKIIGVSSAGMLKIEKENEIISEYAHKQIKFL
jgi:BirA family biotin operon repressor/biotin-[acetyl-CoA-carboxylase] ligase